MKAKLNMKHLQQTLKSATLAMLGFATLGSLSACNRVPNAALYSARANRASNVVSQNTYHRASATRSNYIPGQVVVQFRSRPNPAFLQSFAQQNGLQVLRTAPTGAVLFQQMPGSNTTSTVQALRNNQMVEYSHQNVHYRRNFTINDKRSSEQSGLAIIGMGKAWDLGLGDPNVKIAVIDSGVDLQHPDLQANLVNGYNALTQGQTPPQDDNGHGTHASGIAAAVGDNNLGISGACPRCKLMPVKALDAEGSGNGFDVAMGVVWAVENGATIINMSLGGEVSDPTLERAVKYALSRGTVVVVAAGNESTDKPMYPAALPGVISVGSLDISRERSSFSNYGTWVSVMAPGKNILSTMPVSSTFMTSNEGYKNEYDFMDGTSMAAPMVAGLVGLMKSRHPELTPAQVKARLEGTCIDLGKPGFDPDFGNGMVDAVRAVL